jgi:RNA-binding protein YhbY
MTFSDEFVTKSGQETEEETQYPNAFGITFTPPVSGIALSVVGAIGAIYVLVNFVMPAYESYQKLKTDETAKKEQVNLQKSGVIEKRLQETETKLKQAQTLKMEVLNLFSNQETLDTLLLDINSFFTSKKAKLINYKPQEDGTTVISDGSLGDLVNNKLKRKTIDLELEGTFEETQGILRDIERLQPLLMVKNISYEMTESPFLVRPKLTNKKIQAEMVSLPSMLKTKLTFDAVLPLTPEEAAKLAPPPENQEKKEEQKK